MPLFTALAFLFSCVALVDTPSPGLNNCFVAPATGPLNAMMAVLQVPIDEEPLVRLIGGGGIQPLFWDWASMMGFLLCLLYFVVLCCWLATASPLAQSSASASPELTTVSTLIGSPFVLPVIPLVDTGLFSSSLLSPSSIFSEWSTPSPPFRSQSWDSEEAVPLSFPFLLHLPSFAHTSPASAGLRTMLAYHHYVYMQQQVNDFADDLEQHPINEILPLLPTPSFARPRAFLLVPFFVLDSAFSQFVDIVPEINEFADDMEHRHAELFPTQ